MERWSADLLLALVSGLTVNCHFYVFMFPDVVPCFFVVFLLFPQWTVVGAAGPSGAHAVGPVMSV